ncbi:MAG TPA: prepilin peptidase [Stellaceae bacterium]|nr:prepilin peptidase [Stellaceae bacterium]
MIPEIIALTVFAAAMIVAAVEDFRCLVIPNALPIALCAAWLLHIAAAAGGPVLAPLGVALAVFAVGAALFACGWLGGGDVKLLAAAALWAGPAGLPQLLILTGVIGGALALFLLNPAGRQLAFVARMMIGGGVPPAGAGFETPVPYGVAIAGAALFAILRPYFG